MVSKGVSKAQALVIGLLLLTSFSLLKTGSAFPDLSSSFRQRAAVKTSSSSLPDKIPFNLKETAEISSHQLKPSSQGLRVEDASYKALFNSNGLSYVQKEDGVKKGHLEFVLGDIRVGSKKLEVESTTTPRADQNTARFRRHPYVFENYEAKDGFIEQTWRFKKFLGRGDIVLTGLLKTDLKIRKGADGGLDFLDERGAKVFRYSQATIIGANKKQFKVSPSVVKEGKDYRLKLVLPQKYLKKLSYPLLIDPQIGSDVAISTASNDQMDTAVAFDSVNRRFLVVWTDKRNATEADKIDVYYQLINSDGTLNGSNKKISEVLSNQYFPAVVFNPVDQEFLVAWVDDRKGTFREIYGQRVKSNGDLSGAEIAISIDGHLRENLAMVFDSANKRYLVVWKDDRVGSKKFDIYGQIINADGSLFNTTNPQTNFIIFTDNQPDGDDQENPSAAFDPFNNRFMVVWDGLAQDGDNIYGRLLDTNGQVLGSEFSVSTAPKVQQNPSIAYDSSNRRFLVIWEDNRNFNATEWDIYGQIIDDSGSPFGATQNTNRPISTVLKDQLNPVVGFDSSKNNFFAAWEDKRPSGGNSHLYGQWLKNDGTLLVSDQTANILLSSKRRSERPSIAFDSTNNNFLVSWHDLRSGTNFDVFGSRWSFETKADVTPPSVSAGPDRVGMINETVFFDGSAADAESGVDGASFEWNFGDGTSGTGPSVTHKYASQGSYIVTLSVKDKAGNIGSDTLTVDVKTVERLWGPTSPETAVAISQKGFPSTRVVLVARDDYFTDALAGGPLAKYVFYKYGFQAPILLTSSNQLTTQTRDEIQRLGAEKIYLLGGEGAASLGVENALQKIPGVQNVERLWGATAYGTALAIKGEMVKISIERGSPIPDTAVITTGENFPDSLVISGPAASKDMPILLVKPFTSEPPHETKLALVGVKRVIIVGGPGAVHPVLEEWLRRNGIDVLTRLWGLSEYDTAIDVVSTGDSIFKFDRSTTLVTRGDYFTDALAGGAFASTLGPAPMVLVKPDSVPLSTQYWLKGYKDDIETIYVLGGWGAISQRVKDQVQGFIL